MSDEPKMEEGMLELAKKISKHTLYKMSSRMISVRKLFEIGEFYAVLKILDSQDIMADIRSYKTRIELCDTLKEQLLTDIGHSINELLLRIKTEKILLEEGGMHKIISEYELLIEETRGYVLPLKFATLLFDAAKFIDEYNPNMLAASYYIECIEIMERESTHTEDELALYGNMLYSAGKFFSKKVFEIDIDPTSGEWMDCVNKEIRAEVLKRWKTYKKRAIGYLEKSVDIFSSINKKGRYTESVYFSLDALTNGFIWGYCEEKEKKAYKKLISFIRSSTLSDEFLLSAFCGYANVYIRNNKDDVAQKEISIICQECEKILSILECSSLNPKVLLKISSIFEMKNDFQKAAKFCRLALNGYEELAQESPYIYQTSIAYSLEKLAQFVSWYTENYKINPETFCLLDRTEEIYNKLYEVTDNIIYYRKIEHIINLKYEFRSSEREAHGKYIFDLIRDELMKFFSSHITSGKHKYIVKILDSPILNVGTWIKKVRNKEEYKLYFIWEIDMWRTDCCSIGTFEGGTKEEIYNFLISKDCYDQLKNCIIKDLYKSWHMD